MTTADQADLPDTTELPVPPPPRGAARFVGPIVVSVALLSALATFLVLADYTPIAGSHNVVLFLLAVSGAAIFFLVVIIGREVWPVIQGRRRGRAGARLHVRIVGLFSIIAATPAILVAIVANLILDRGLDRLLAARGLISNTLVV